MRSLDFGINGFADYLDLVDKKIKEQSAENIDGVNRLLQSSGKRLRPSLVIAIVCLSGKKIDDIVINAAAAVELVHIASLVHDDIIDGGTLRWGKPTINLQEGIDEAILAGDYLIAKGCLLATKVNAEAGSIMAETVANLCSGQAEEIQQRFNTARSKDSLLSSIKGKTSSMFMTSCYLGGLVSELDKSQLEALSKFGENFGIAFQYEDDIGDIRNDIEEGNYALPVILSLQGPNKVRLQKLLKNSDENFLQILEILKKDGSIDQALKEAENYKQKALMSLQSLENERLAEALQSFVNNYSTHL